MGERITPADASYTRSARMFIQHDLNGIVTTNRGQRPAEDVDTPAQRANNSSGIGIQRDLLAPRPSRAEGLASFGIGKRVNASA